MLLMCL